MNKCLMRYATIMFCIINAMTFGYGEKTPLGLHAKLSKGSTIFTPQQWKAAKVTGGLAATAGISYLAEQCVKDGSGKEFYNGKYAWGYAQALKLSSLCLSVSPMFNEAWGDQFSVLAHVHLLLVWLLS